MGFLQLHRGRTGFDTGQGKGILPQHKLVKAQKMPCLGERPVYCLDIVKFDRYQALSRQRDRQGDTGFPVGSNGQGPQRPGFYRFPVDLDHIADFRQIPGIDKVQGVAKYKLVFPHHFGADGAGNLSQFIQPCMGSTVGVNQAVHTEVPVVGILSKIAAVVVDLFPLYGLAHVNRVVAPLPHKPAAKTVIPVDLLVVVLQIPGAIAHGMGKLALNKGFGLFPLAK